MPSITVENYLKQLYLEERHNPGQLVSMGKLASAMNVVPGTATTMVKALSESGLVEYEPRGGTRLTPLAKNSRCWSSADIDSSNCSWSKCSAWTGAKFTRKLKNWSTRSATR